MKHFRCGHRSWSSRSKIKIKDHDHLRKACKNLYQNLDHDLGLRPWSISQYTILINHLILSALDLLSRSIFWKCAHLCSILAAFLPSEHPSVVSYLSLTHNNRNRSPSAAVIVTVSSVILQSAVGHRGESSVLSRVHHVRVSVGCL